MNSTIGALKLDDFRGTPHQSERRHWPRQQVDHPVQYLPYEQSPDMEYKQAQLVDVSVKGLGMITREQLPVGELFLVKLLLKDVVQLIYAVRHCRQTGVNEYQVGAQLTGFIGSAGCNDPERMFELLASNDNACTHG